eukprot:SAG31_NODE_18769_length_623_cov_1.162214_1_plen_60_part_01
MLPPAALMLRVLLVLALGVATTLGAESCTFTPNCDYGPRRGGSRSSAPAATKEACCAACA